MTDSRFNPENNSIRRRRECSQCERRFTTYESVELTMQVRKRDGRYEDFLQEKMIQGLNEACRHTKISHDQVVELVSRLTMKLQQQQIREVSTTQLGELLMKELRHLDRVAYIRFACVYRRFQEIDELIEEIELINV